MVAQRDPQGTGCGSQGRLRRPGGQIEPLPFPVGQAGQADPVQDGLLVPVQVHDDGGRRAVHEVNATLSALTFDEEAAHACTGQPVQLVLLTS